MKKDEIFVIYGTEYKKTIESGLGLNRISSRLLRHLMGLRHTRRWWRGFFSI